MASRVLLAALLGLVAAIATTTHAQAVTRSVEPNGFFDGDISNWLPSSYTVKIADFGTGQLPGCSTWNAGWFSCTHYWLPSGRADDQIRGNNFDTDGYMVENATYRVKIYNGNGALLHNRLVPAGVWTDFPSGDNINCQIESGEPVCRNR